MNKRELDDKIAGIAKTLMSYCVARTANRFEAEDLAHDVILEIYKSVDALRDERAFYAFMWAIAGNVYKRWCKNKVKSKECKFTETLFLSVDITEENSDLFLLRRELTLLTEKYRKAVILYYVENMSCGEISRKLSISESMVKYLLFKSRQILKEGMNMERTFGSQSYNPKELIIAFWGNGVNRYSRLGESKIAQNILFACYNDALSAEQISLEIGVALPYMEDVLDELLEYELLKKEGNRYYTNLVIFTKDLSKEVGTKTALFCKKIAMILEGAIDRFEQEVRRIGFFGFDMPIQILRWQLVSFILHRGIIDILQNKIKLAYPKDMFGEERFVWAYEKEESNELLSRYGVGLSNTANAKGDSIRFMDFPINGATVHHYYFNRENVINIFLDIAKGNTDNFSENDKVAVADLIRKGYALSTKSGLAVNVPVFTEKQYQKLEDIFASTAEEIVNEAEGLMATVTKVMKNHIPTHLKKFARDMAYLRLFEDAVSSPVAILCHKNYLLPYNGDGMLPTTYIKLK